MCLQFNSRNRDQITEIDLSQFEELFDSDESLDESLTELPQKEVSTKKVKGKSSKNKAKST